MLVNEIQRVAWYLGDGHTMGGDQQAVNKCYSNFQFTVRKNLLQTYNN